MKKIFQVLTLSILCNAVFGQLKTNTYKANFSGTDKRIVIFSANLSLEIVGTSGNEVIIEALEDRRELPAEADGLKIVSPGGGIDNTGVGANVVIEGATMKIKIPKSKYYGSYVIKVPRDINISVRENGNAYGKWLITGMKGEVEAETSYSTLNIKNVSGPIVARGGYGKIYVEYDQLNQSRPNSISASGAVDITLPADAKANLKVQATYADFFTDFDVAPVKVEEKGEKGEKSAKNNAAFPNGQKPNAISISGSVNSTTLAEDLAKVKEKGINWNEIATSSDCNCGDTNATIGTINGGGVNLIIKSDHGNVYLRKKK